MKIKKVTVYNITQTIGFKLSDLDAFLHSAIVPTLYKVSKKQILENLEGLIVKEVEMVIKVRLLGHQCF